jgi:hypothetical protein
VVVLAAAVSAAAGIAEALAAAVMAAAGTTSPVGGRATS